MILITLFGFVGLIVLFFWPLSVLVHIELLSVILWKDEG